MDTKHCGKCQITKPVKEFHFKKTEDRYNSWCKACLYENQQRRWVERKKLAIELMGGACCRCGYNKNYAALDFHHQNPSEKEFDWSKMRLRSWSKLIAELAKCILVCRNCHAEIHWPNATLEDFNPTVTSSLSRQFICEDADRIRSTGCCEHCKEPVYGTRFCSHECSHTFHRKVNRPKKEELLDLLSKKSYCAVARMFGVSDNAVRKWVKSYDLIKPS